jgi:hypothetical protein
VTAPAVRSADNAPPDLISVGGGWVLLSGPALADVSRAVTWTLQQARRDGIRSPRLTRLDAALRTETAAANGHTDAPAGGSVLPFPQDVMSTEEVAAAMRMSPRHVRRRAHELGGRKIAGSWCFDPVIIAAERENP